MESRASMGMLVARETLDQTAGSGGGLDLVRSVFNLMGICWIFVCMTLSSCMQVKNVYIRL